MDPLKERTTALSTGIDIVSISRIEKSSGEPLFLKRVFTEGEIEYSFGKRFPHRSLAGRFAAKEAVFKALGTKGVGWRDIEVVVSKREGRPKIVLHSEALKLLGPRKVSISISYSGDQAVAFAVIE